MCDLFRFPRTLKISQHFYKPRNCPRCNATLFSCPVRITPGTRTAVFINNRGVINKLYVVREVYPKTETCSLQSEGK